MNRHMKKHPRKLKGFTLFEMLLVLVIVSSLLIVGLNYTTQKSDDMRRDKTVLQIEQILNAGMSYYVNNSQWPGQTTNATCGVTGTGAAWNTLSSATTSLVPNYIPPLSNFNNPFPTTTASAYQFNCIAQGSFYVATQMNTAANAALVAGRLPMGYRTTALSALTTSPPAACTTGANCNFVVTSVNIPGQNLNNARSINFAGIYHNGACVPKPSCPSGMTPQIFTSVSGASGTNDPSLNVYPISSFSAYAADSTSTCASGATVACPAVTGVTYWRVCLDVWTEKGSIYANNGGTGANSPGANQTILALTRCAPTNESPAGTPIGVWAP